jgi:uncharacterized repeat protein (TIGR01451 family)
MTFSTSPVLVLIDSRVDSYHSLVSGVQPNAEVLILDPDLDGIEQIGKVLADRQSIRSLHIVSHGRSGEIQLGTACLNEQTIERYASQLMRWANALTKQAEILLYGCEVAAGELGKRFVQQLSTLTGAAVAASINRTGNAALGGDWVLEMQTRAVQSPLAFQYSVLEAYQGVLAPALPNLIYASRDNGSTELRTLDLATAQSTVVGTLAFATFAITRQASTGRIYYIETGNNGRVAYWDANAAGANKNTILGNTGVNVQFLKLAQATDGTLYGLDSTTTNLYSINPTTGAATLLGAITGGTPAFAAGSGDLAFDPTDPTRFYITVTNAGAYRLYSVDITNPNAPVATYIGAAAGLSNAGSGSLAFGPDGNLYATSQVGGVNNLYRLDRATGNATLIGPMAVPFSDFGSLPTQTDSVDVTVTVSTSVSSAGPGTPITYTITVTNSSTTLDLSNIAVADTVPADITGVTWSATTAPGVTFPSTADQSGTGNSINSTVNLNAGSSVTYTVTGTVSPTAVPGGTITNTATATVPQGINDPNGTDNTFTIQTPIATASAINNPPLVASPTVGIVPGKAVNIAGLSATDSDGTIASYTISSLPPAAQGTLFLGDPAQGGQTVTAGQVLTPTQLGQLFFRAASGFTGGTFTYTATDNAGANAATPGTVTLRANTPPTLPSAPVVSVPGSTTVLSGLAGTDPDGRVSSYTISSLPTSDQGTLFLGDPAQGGIPITVGQQLTADQINQLFFQPTASFSGASFSYLATDNTGANSSPATVLLSLSASGSPGSATPGCMPGRRIRGNNGPNRLTGGSDSDTLFGANGNDTLRGRGCDDVIEGNQGNDRLFGNDGNDRLRGRQNNDRLDGGKGNDILNGGLGRDRVNGGAGVDLLFGSRGDDTINGNGGSDRLEGGIDKDLLRGGTGNDLIRGRQGNDFLVGGKGNDREDGGTGADRLDGQRGEDVLISWRGNDTLNGGPGADFLGGKRGNDRLYGNSQSDTLLGGVGNDILVGGLAADMLKGGPGRDRFLYRKVTEGGDMILEFQSDRDTIDLRRLFNRPNYNASNRFERYVRVRQSDANTIIRVDTNGNASGGFKPFITLENIVANTLSATNFNV